MFHERTSAIFTPVESQSPIMATYIFKCVAGAISKHMLNLGCSACEYERPASAVQADLTCSSISYDR